MSTISNKSSNTSSSEDDNNNNNELRRGPWTMQEDTMLTHYIACNGEGRWNFLAKRSGLRRTGKSCRLRWLNYLKPDVKRGNLTPEEQLLILDLHSKWGNRWSKIAQYLPGRTDNEIKNYWRTRVQKQAKHLKIEAESSAFQDIIRRFWIPRLKQKILVSSSSASLEAPSVQNPLVPIPIDNNYHAPQLYSSTPQLIMPQNYPMNEHSLNSESLNMSHMFQFSEYPNYPLNNLMVNTDNNSSTVLDGFCYGMDAYGHTGSSFSEPPKSFESHAGVCHMAGGDWAGNDFFSSMWTMDEF